MPYIAVGEENTGSIDLYYEDYGSGRPVVLVHGWPLSSTSWERQVTALLDAGYRVVVYDRRGFGNSSRPATGYTFDTFAADLHKVIIGLDLHQVVLVGFAMGTGDCIRYIGTTGGERVVAAVFLASLPPFLLRTLDNPTGVDPSYFDGILTSLKKDRYAFASSFLSDFYNVRIVGEDRISDSVVRAAWNVAADASAKALTDSVSAWKTDFREDIARIDLPTLVIHGDDDWIYPIASTGLPLHQRLKKSRWVVVEGGAHGLLWTHAEEVNREIVAFLISQTTKTTDT